MAETSGLFSKLNLNNMFNVGIYIPGIILIASFIIAPIEISITILRSVCLKILFLSLIFREIGKLNLFNDDKDVASVLFYYVLRGIYLYIIFQLIVNSF